MVRAGAEQHGGAAEGARYVDGAAAASRKAAEMVDVLSDKVGVLVREFQQKTVALPRDDPDIFIRLVRVQGWFLENLERRLNAAKCGASRSSPRRVAPRRARVHARRAELRLGLARAPAAAGAAQGPHS